MRTNAEQESTVQPFLEQSGQMRQGIELAEAELASTSHGARKLTNVLAHEKDPCHLVGHSRVSPSCPLDLVDHSVVVAPGKNTNAGRWKGHRRSPGGEFVNDPQFTRGHFKSMMLEPPPEVHPVVEDNRRPQVTVLCPRFRRQLPIRLPPRTNDRSVGPVEAVGQGDLQAIRQDRVEHPSRRACCHESCLAAEVRSEVGDYFGSAPIVRHDHKSAGLRELHQVT